MKLPKRNKIDKNKSINFTKKYVNTSQQVKPNGFWYSCYDDWYKWVVKEDITDFLHKYIHKIIINKNVTTNIMNKDKNKLLVIKNIKDFDLFNKIYGTKKVPRIIHGMNHQTINWKKVANDYGGIEICPFIRKRQHYVWYGSWDVASGCIWNTKPIIQTTKLIYKKINKKYVKIVP